jgi:hypothetical protein
MDKKRIMLLLRINFANASPQKDALSVSATPPLKSAKKKVKIAVPCDN